ncbi:uncharacterized protein LOC129582334 [Paramacrobiotus metropolitanus]|uniref:uncharacterized protein LOC129582334 n=1 Tax=Paramacrobiotus metropolitanus TaxID=2943436 RepID=UPI00244564AD|nr:uncharacterized protein LOC129582334 [Paramacrobiotus metropolitanus]
MQLFSDPGLLYEWNAVDVEVDGRLQRGHVVGMEENGSVPPRLIVDFWCPAQRSVVVEYGRIIHGRLDHDCIASVAAGMEVLVLLHDYPGRPWIWYPGTVLHSWTNGRLQVYAMVEVTRAEYRSAELVPCSQIRRSMTHEAFQRKLVRPRDFVMGTCRVPEGYRTEWARNPSTAESLLRQVQNKFRVTFFSIRSRTMHYVRRSGTAAVTDKAVAEAFELTRQKRGRRTVSPRNEHAMESAEATQTLPYEPPTTKPPSVDDSQLALPLELLKEVFLSLDTVDRQRCRRTCQLWEALLTCADTCSDIRLTRREYGLFNPNNGLYQDHGYDYVVYACLFKHATAATRTIIHRVYSKHVRYGPTHCDTREDLTEAHDAIVLAVSILDRAGLRIHRWIEYGRSLVIPMRRYGGFNWRRFCADLVGLNAQLASRCDRLIWAKYSLDCQNEGEGVFMRVRIPWAVFPLNSIDEAQMWDVFEKHLCGESRFDAQCIARFIAGSSNSRARAKEVKRILEVYQACDPRASAHYRGHKWTLSTVPAVDVRQLNKFCLLALLDYMNCYEVFGSEDSSEYGYSSSDRTEDD